jgi:hypothetical protein
LTTYSMYHMGRRDSASRPNNKVKPVEPLPSSVNGSIRVRALGTGRHGRQRHVITRKAWIATAASLKLSEGNAARKWQADELIADGLSKGSGGQPETTERALAPGGGPLV